MALNDYRAVHGGTGPTLAAPTTSESIIQPDEKTGLLVTIGGTATTITLARPTPDVFGVAVAAVSTGALSNTTRLIKVDQNYKDPATGNVAVTFSQVTGVTASVVRF